jgi:glycine oxidase
MAVTFLHYLIIGGGIIGMLTAHELRLAKHQVTLVERQQPARESSWAGGGIISPLFPWRYLDSVTHLASWSQQHYPELCAKLARDTNTDPQLTNSGLLIVAPNEIDQAKAWAKQHQHKLEPIDAATFKQLEPAAAQPSDNALWMPAINQVRNPRLGRALKQYIVQQGVSLLSDTTVTQIDCHQQQCLGVKTTRETLSAGGVIVCAGAWSQQLLADYTSPPAIRPMRGQMLIFKTEPGTIQRMVLEENRYVIPRRDGRVLFGSTIEDVGFDKQTTQEAYDELRDIAISRFPVLAKYPIEHHWAGLRPGSPAGIPYISAHPEIANLYINAGHYRNGIVLGLASARLAADIVLQRTPIIDPKPYHWTAGRG